MSKLFGYARVSTTDQDLTVQIETLTEAGVEPVLIFSEKASGTKTEGRQELERVLSLLRKGDVLCVTRIDRLARSMHDFSRITHDLKLRGVGVRVVQQGIDTSVGGPIGELTMNLLGAFAQFETELRRERQLEGIAKAKAEGVYKGRAKTIDDDMIRKLKALGRRPSEIRKELGVSESAVFRALRAEQMQ